MATQLFPEISIDFFEDWGEDVRVRRIQPKLKTLVEQAKKKGLSLEEEMKAQRFKDYKQLVRACPQFDLTCWPSELAELGSGFVHYFHLLWFLVGMLILVFLLQIPIMSSYSQNNWLVGWHWHSWGDSWTEKDTCGCIGGSNLSNGPANSSQTVIDYGTSCRIWDEALCWEGCPDGFHLATDDSLPTCPGDGICCQSGAAPDCGADCRKRSCTAAGGQWIPATKWELAGGQWIPEIKCEMPKAGVFSNPGRWCCTRWCFARSSCITPPNTKWGFFTNVHYQGMTRSIASCEQDLQRLSACPFSDNAPFNEADVEAVPDEMYVGSSWLTPGNYGPDRADSMVVPAVYLVVVIVLSLLLLGMQQFQAVVDSKVDAGLTSPNDFAALVKGLPTTATDERAIGKFFEENALRGRKAEIVKVVIGWDASAFREKILQIRKLQKSLKLLAPSDPQTIVIKQEIVEINKILASTSSNTAAKLNSSGTVVVVFRYQEDLRAFLDRWQNFWAWWSYDDADNHECLPFTGTKRGPPLPRFPVGGIPVSRIKAARAPNPGDINWDQFTACGRKNRRLLVQTAVIMTGLVLISLTVAYALNKFQEYLRKESSGYSGRALSLLPATGLAIANMCLMVAARKFGSWEYNDSHTEQEFSIGLKMLFALLINTGAVILFTNAQPKEWYISGGLVDDLFYILIIDALLPPIVFYFDVKYCIYSLKRRKLTDDTLKAWNERRPPGGVARTAQQAQDLNALRKEVDGFKRFFEPSEMYNPRRYANVMNTFLCSLFFAPVFPFAILIGIAGILLQYCIDKYLLLRWYKRPSRPYNAFLAMWSISFLKSVVPVGLSVSFYIFLSPSWKEKDQVRTLFIIALLISIFVAVVPGKVLRTLLGMRLLLRRQGFTMAAEGADYYRSQYLWSKEMKYHKDHFLYKVIPETKNPEFLSPDVDSAVNLDDIKCTYSAATARASDSAGDAPSQVAFRGGVVLGTSRPFGASRESSVQLSAMQAADAAAEVIVAEPATAVSVTPFAAATTEISVAGPRVFGLQEDESALEPPDLFPPGAEVPEPQSPVAPPAGQGSPLQGALKAHGKGKAKQAAKRKSNIVPARRSTGAHSKSPQGRGSHTVAMLTEDASAESMRGQESDAVFPSPADLASPSQSSESEASRPSSEVPKAPGAPVSTGFESVQGEPSPSSMRLMPPPPAEAGLSDSDVSSHAPSGSDATSASFAPGTVVWEFSRGTGKFSLYGADCQSFIERQFQKYINENGHSQVRVKTGDRTVSVNFEKMSSKVVDPPSKKISELRRIEK